MKEKVLHHKKIGEEIVKVIKHHEAQYDDMGVLIKEPYDEEVEVVKPIMGDMYEEVEVKEIEVPQEHEKPTQEDRIEAQVMYTALMTDTLLEV